MINVAKVVGLNSDSSCAQTLVEIGGQAGELFIIVVGEGEDAFSKTRFALSEAENVFFTSEQPIPARLGEVVVSVKNNLKGLANLQILVASVQPSENTSKPLYILSEVKTVKAVLIRDSQLLDIISASDTPQLVSGFIKPEDKIVLCTSTLFNLLGDERILKDFSVEVFDEEVSSRFPLGQVYPTAAILIESRLIEENKDEPSQLVRVQPARRAVDFSRIVPRSRRLVLGLLGVLLMLVVAGGVANLVRKTSPAQVSSNQIEQPHTQQAMNVYQINEDLPVWLDLSLIKNDFSARALSVSVGKLLVLDTNQGSLVEINLSSKVHKLLAGKDRLGEADMAAINGSFGFIHSVDKGLVRVGIEDLEVKNIIPQDDEWGIIQDIYGFGSNIYLLDKSKHQIWKYLPTESGYSDKFSYLTDGTTADLSSATRLQIDSSVWVLNQDGSLLKFTQGVKDNFSYSKLDKGIKDPKSFFVSSETENLYLLDSGNNRLLVLSKSGEYQAQYLNPKMGEFIDLVVDEESKRIYLLDGRKIYLLELK